DVALPVVKRFIDAVRGRALGTEVSASLSRGQALIGILHRELANLLASEASGLALNVQPPLVVLLAGLQGAGQTTTAAKLARWFSGRRGGGCLSGGRAVRRRAATPRLEGRAGRGGAAFRPPPVADSTPAAIAAAGLARARTGVYDALIVDTAGRLHVDAELM